MAPLVLHTAKESPRNYKILIAAGIVGVELVIPPFEFGKDNKTPEFLKKNPLGKIPVLTTESGSIFESNAIARHIARLDRSKGLLGRNALEESQVDQWLDFTTNEVEPSVLTWVGPILGYIPFNKEQDKQARENLAKVVRALNDRLETRTYLVGERLTLADIVLATALLPLYKLVWDPKYRAPNHNLNRWFETITMQDKFIAVVKLEPTHYCTVARKPQATKKEEPKKKTEEGEEGEKKEEKKKEAPKKKKDDDDDDDDDEEEKKPKAKNPLDLLPKSTFDLDQFKREYSNKPIRDEAIPYLWANFDAAGYSLWWSKYKYNDENTKLFMTTNLVSVWYQRLRIHKYAFGVTVIAGTEAEHEISGFWIIRGQEFPEIFADTAGTDSYDWIKIPFEEIGRAS